MPPRRLRTLTISEGGVLSGPPLDVVADIWSSRRSGWLRVGPRRAAICRGGIIDGSGGELVELALGGGPRAAVMVAEVRFEPAAIDGLPDALSVGLSVWAAALREADPAATGRVLGWVLHRIDRGGCLDQLPLSEPVRALLSAPPGQRLGSQLEELGIAPTEVGRELAALVRLGLIRFQRAQRSPGGEGVDYMLLLRRLRREVEVLEAADDWAVLALSPGSPPEAIRAAGERMGARYRGLRCGTGQPEEVGALAGRILERIERAVEGLSAAPGEGEDPVEEEAFRLGRSAMEAGRVAEAARHFAAARARRPDSARNLAWLGWAVFWDESRPLAPRRSEALELLQLAAQRDGGESPEPAFFLAHVEAERGEIGMAEARLSRMLRRHPGHQRGRRLFLKLRRRRAMSA